MVYDVVIVGGGAAGLAAAINIKQQKSELSVAVLEALERVCKKLITTGNGRCNITNAGADTKSYHGASAEFTGSVLSRFTVADTVEFFKKIGVEIVFEADGRAYPFSYQASSVVDALRLGCEELGVNVICSQKVTDIKSGKVLTDGGEYLAKNIIVTGGLLSGGNKVGSDGSVISILKKLGIKTAPLTPAIVQLKTDTGICKSLKGIKTNCTATLKKGSAVIRSEYGEVLFCDYGLSGPPILQISRNAERGTRVFLDLAPEYDFDSLLQLLYQRKQNLKKRSLENYLTGFLNKRVGQAVIKHCGLLLSLSVTSLNDGDIYKIATAIKALGFEVMSNTGFLNSQVTAGGVLHTELDCNLMLKKLPHVYLAGEIINVDGDCGGYNLQWAWSSAAVVAKEICK